MLLDLQAESLRTDSAAEPTTTTTAPADERGTMEKAQDWAIAFAPKLVGALLVFLIGRWVAKVVTRGVERVMTTRRVEATLTASSGT